MRVLLYLVGVLFVWGAAKALGYVGVLLGVPQILTVVPHALVIAVALGAYFILGRQDGRKRESGVGVLLGQVLAYLIGAALLVHGTGNAVMGAYGLLYYTLHPGERNEFSGLFVFALPLGALYVLAGMTVLIAAGWIGTGPVETGPLGEGLPAERRQVAKSVPLRVVGVFLLVLGGALMALPGGPGFLPGPWTRFLMTHVMAAAPGAAFVFVGLAVIAAGTWALIAAVRYSTGKAPSQTG